MSERGPWEDYSQPAAAPDGPWKAYQSQDYAQQPDPAASFDERFDAVPQAFLDRVRAGSYLTGDIGGAMPEATAEFSKTFEGSQLKGAWDLFTLPGRVKSGETRLDTGAGMSEGVGMGVAIALGRMNEGVGNSHGVPIIDQGQGRYARPFVDPQGNPQVAQVGSLPQPQDFAAAGKALDSANAPANLKQMWEQDGIHPAEAVHDAQTDAFLKNEITSKREEIKLDPETEQILWETGGKPGDLSAAITPPDEVPLDVQPASRPGSLIASMQNAADKLFDIGHDIQMKLTPMARGTVDSMATVKDYMNSMRRNAWDVSRIDTDLMKRFDPEQRARMWNAMDEESLSLRLGEPESAREHQGLATLTPEERAIVVDLDTRQQLAWLRARDLGMVEGEGIAMHAPRMVINVPKDDLVDGI